MEFHELDPPLLSEIQIWEMGRDVRYVAYRLAGPCSWSFLVVFCLKICLLSIHFAKFSACGGLTQAKQLVERAAGENFGILHLLGRFPNGKMGIQGCAGAGGGSRAKLTKIFQTMNLTPPT